MGLKVAVVGGGIAGLTAAWELVQGGAEPVVLETGPRAGGVIVTERRDGCIVEGGPDGFLASESELPELARQTGIADRVVEQRARGSSLWTGTRLEPLEEGRAAALLGIAVAPEGVSQGFRSFAGGMADIVEAAAARLGQAVRVKSAVASVVQSASGYRLAMTGGGDVEVAGVVLAVPAWVAARFLSSLGVRLAEDLVEVHYFPSLTVSLVYDEQQVRAPLEGTGFVVAQDAPASGGVLRACTYASRKFPDRAPEGQVLLRAFLGAVDKDPGAVAHALLANILAITGSPLWTKAFSWVRGLPRYGPDHAARVTALRALIDRLPPLAIAGAGIDGAGVSACVRSGRTAARLILARLS
ncbi:MAG TPA: FAD-dependent oxidoreductase [Gemmatimonadales bacterium]|nr:FAD-dependent oxidoreductase [Gemmatimonadales bacterium]